MTFPQCRHLSLTEMNRIRGVGDVCACAQELRSCVKVEVGVLGSLSIIVPTVSVTVKRH